MSSTTNHIGTSHLSSRAWRICALAKAKCVPRPGGLTAKCERCHRLKNDCATQTPSIRLRKPHKLLAQLEEKFDGIVSLLKQQKSTISQDAIPAYSPLATNENSLPKSSIVSDLERSNIIPYQHIPHLIPTSLEPRKRQSVHEKSTSACLLAHANTDLEPNDVEIERLVKLYQSEMTAKFLFLVIWKGGLTGKEWLGIGETSPRKGDFDGG